jgi:hypothetical protein
MFLSLEKPGSDKTVSLIAYDLDKDDGFNPSSHQFVDVDIDRSRVNRAVVAVNDNLGGSRKALPMLFNQFAWEGTTGWEYWSDNYALVLKHALTVAAALGQSVHVRVEILDEVRRGAEEAGIKFDIQPAQPVEHPNTSEFMFVNRDVTDGKYVVLTNVMLPGGLPAPPEL